MEIDQKEEQQTLGAVLKIQNYALKQKTIRYKSNKSTISRSTVYHCCINRGHRKAC